MSVLDQPEVIRSMQAAMAADAAAVAAPVIPSGPAIDGRPLAGGEINIRLALSPGMIVMIAAPITVLVTMVLGWILLTTAAMPIFFHEMWSGAIVNTLGGIASALPIFYLMKRGAVAIAQAGILAIAIRCGVILMGLMVCLAPAWGLAKMPLVYWVLGGYFPMLMVETAVIAWLANKAKH